MRPYLDPMDHAFASGPVYFRPTSAAQAERMTGSPADGVRLSAVFDACDRNATSGERLRLGLAARFIASGEGAKIGIGTDCAVRGLVRCENGGRVSIGNFVYIGDQTIVSAWSAVTIGDETLIAHGVNIFDNDSHPLDPAERSAHFKAILTGKVDRVFDIAQAPIIIGARCWIGFGSAVMKGVTIGDGAVVAAGAIVTRDVPAGTVVAGNPARVVRRVDGSPIAKRPGWLDRVLDRSR